MTAILTDALIVLTLIGAIVYAQVVNRRVKRLMVLLRELEPAVQEFSRAVDKSEASVVQMQTSLKQAREQPTSEAAQSSSFSIGESPLFSSRRVDDVRELGVRVIRDKKDLVRQFFDATRTAGKA
jgi:hypothetical protein